MNGLACGSLRPNKQVNAAAVLLHTAIAFPLIFAQMASQPAPKVQCLAQVVDEENLDAKLTFEEALCCTDGMRLVSQAKPLVVNKPVGSCKIADLPAKGMLSETSSKKRAQFLDVIMDFGGELDLQLIEQLFTQQR